MSVVITADDNVNMVVDSSAVRTLADFVPYSNNAYLCGSGTRKWSHVWTVEQHTGDLHFMNNWILRELHATKEDLKRPDADAWLRKNKPGIQIMDEDGNVVFAIDKKHFYTDLTQRSLSDLLCET